MSDTPTGNDVWPSAYIDTDTAMELQRELNEAHADRLRLLTFIKELNATKFAHGREYRSRCGKFLQALTTQPPVVVDKRDADALVEALEEIVKRQYLGDNAITDIASEPLKSYRTKYQCSH